MKTVIIFGANSQGGYYIKELYLLKGYEVIGVSRTGNWRKGDVSSLEFVEKLIRHEKPDIIFHIAASSTTRHHVLFENHETIGTGTLNILETVYRFCPECKVFLTGSGLQFQSKGEPIHESDEFEATSAYSAERIHSVYVARYFRSLGVKVYIGYLFHHESRYRKSTHISQIIVQLAKRIADGSDEKLEIGDLSVLKEWGFAGDIAKGISVLVAQEEVFEAVIGTGKAYSIEDWIKICFDTVRKDWTKHISICETYTPEYKYLISNPETINSLGWNSKVGINKLANLMF